MRVRSWIKRCITESESLPRATRQGISFASCCDRRALEDIMTMQEGSRPLSQVHRALAKMESAGFKDRNKNLALLAIHENDVEAAINELLD